MLEQWLDEAAKSGAHRTPTTSLALAAMLREFNEEMRTDAQIATCVLHCAQHAKDIVNPTQALQDSVYLLVHVSSRVSYLIMQF